MSYNRLVSGSTQLWMRTDMELYGIPTADKESNSDNSNLKRNAKFVSPMEAIAI